ncbi:hypothetical protein CNY89_23460, partial [Amaricoccus sp. HAR-UPW-R2A-40]
LSDKYEGMRNSQNGWSIQEAGMAQLDDIVGSVMDYLKTPRPGASMPRASGLFAGSRTWRARSPGRGRGLRARLHKAFTPVSR